MIAGAMTRTIESLDVLRTMQGQELGPSDWLTVDQDRVRFSSPVPAGATIPALLAT
jgi:acyl dehydratase